MTDFDPKRHTRRSDRGCLFGASVCVVFVGWRCVPQVRHQRRTSPVLGFDPAPPSWV